MPSLTFETPEILIERLDEIVMADWAASGRVFGRSRDPIDEAMSDGWCVVRSPACAVSVSHEPFMLWINPLETRVIEWPKECHTRIRVSVSRLIEMLPAATEDLLTTAIEHLSLGSDARALAQRWIKPIDWGLAEIDPSVRDATQHLLEHWRPTGSHEAMVEREMMLAADQGARYWQERARVISLMLRLIISPSAAVGSELRTVARGALERLDQVTDEGLHATHPTFILDPHARAQFKYVLQAWIGLMARCADRLMLPGGRSPFPTAGQGVELRFQFPPRLLWLWVRRARRLDDLVRQRTLAKHVDSDLVSVSEDHLDDRRHEMLVSTVVCAATMLQYSQGSPALQEEMAQIAERLMPAVHDPSLAGLHPRDRGPRLARLRSHLPRALEMGQILANRGLNLGLVKPSRLGLLQSRRSMSQFGPMHLAFPLKLGPEQPLPYAHLLVAQSFEAIAPLFQL